MKKVTFIAFLAVASSSGFPQGVLNFANFGNGANAPVFDTDGTTKLTGTNFSADLYWANGIVTDSCALQPLNAPAFFSSTAPGYFFGGTRTIPAAPGTTITVQVRVWPTAAGSSWLEAGCALGGGRIGSSIMFPLTLAAPPDATNMTELPSFGLSGYILSVIVFVQNVRVLPNQVEFDLVPNSLVPSVVVEVTTNLTNPVWSTVQTFNCVACPVHFSDLSPMNAPARSYRISPTSPLAVPTVISLSFAPQLTIEAHASNVAVTWPTNYLGLDYSSLVLQSATNLASPVWTTNLPAPIVSNGQKTVKTPIPGTQQFFRLSQ